MKKFLFTIIAFMFAFAISDANAQAVKMAGSGDSLSNTASKSCTYKVPYTPTAVTIQYKLTEASGTPAGKTYLYASIDGSTYLAIDSMTATNYTSQTINSKLFVVANPKAYVYYKTTHTGVGTMKVYIEALILTRKD